MAVQTELGLICGRGNVKNDPDTTKVRDVYELDDVEIRDGDVAIITLDTKLSDQYTTGVLYLN